MGLPVEEAREIREIQKQMEIMEVTPEMPVRRRVISSLLMEAVRPV